MDLYPILKKGLFLLDAEQAHNLTFAAMGWAGGALLGPFAPSRQLIWSHPVQISGLSFKNRVGLAAGLDKNALRLPAWEQLGFGHVEIGTVTPLPQDGNPKPRLFRLPADNALLNRMGFNNDGADRIRDRLDERPPADRLIVGGNIGKNKATPDADAPADYVRCLRRLHDAVDYFTINVSSPNTPGLRGLQSREPLLRLLGDVQTANQGVVRPRPLFVKIAPDLTEAEVADVVFVAEACQLAGIVATNTTLSRDGLRTPAPDVKSLGAGGLSGQPLTERAQAFAQRLRALMPASLALIGCGGIMAGQDAASRLAAGAALVQLYSGLVYHGPGLVADCLRATQAR